MSHIEEIVCYTSFPPAAFQILIFSFLDSFQICRTVDSLLADPKTKAIIDSLWPEGQTFVAPARPFMRMDYRDAIAWLNEHNITRPGEDGVDGPHVVGDDIAEAAERKMTDAIGVPIFLMKFPKEIVSLIFVSFF